MSNEVIEFQKRLLTDEATRKAFAANPRKFLDELGVELPGNVKLPSSIPLKEIEEQVKHTQEALAEQKIELNSVDARDSSSVTRFIEEAFPLRTSDLKIARVAQEEALGRLGPVHNPADRMTVAVVGAVVAAVVAVPVAVFGKATKGFEELVRSARGVEGITRIGSNFVLTGPGGIRVENLDAPGVVNIIKGLR